MHAPTAAFRGEDPEVLLKACQVLHAAKRVQLLDGGTADEHGVKFLDV